MYLFIYIVAQKEHRRHSFARSSVGEMIWFCGEMFGRVPITGRGVCLFTQSMSPASCTESHV